MGCGSACATAAEERSKRNSPVGTKVSEGRGGTPGTRVEIPLHPTMNDDHGKAGCSHVTHKGPWWSRYSPVAWGRPHSGTGGCPKEAVTLWEFCAGEGLLAGLVLSLASQGQLSTELWSTPQDSCGGGN